MSEDVIPFSGEDYTKLRHPVFMTIRRRDKYGEPGDVKVIEKGPPGQRVRAGEAEIIDKEAVTLHGINDALLMYDTESRTRKEAEESLQSFYRNPIEPDEELTMYWLRWIEWDPRMAVDGW